LHKFSTVSLIAIPLILTLLISLIPVMHIRIHVSKASGENEEWVYYGFAPRANFSSFYTPVGHVFTKSSGRNRVTVIGYNDSTRVTVYDLTGNKMKVIESFTIDRMKVHSVGFPNEKEANISIPVFFKVVSDKPVAVLLSSGSYNVSEISVAGQSIYYPSTDGGFAGKEFIFLSVPATNIHAREGWDYAVYAIEDSVIEIRDKNDKLLKTITLPANSSKRLELFSNKIYRVKSTGRIIIGSWSSWSFTVCPSHMGGHVGRLFYANPYQTALIGSPILLILAQEKPAHVKIFDMETESLLIEKDLQPREMWFINRKVKDLEGLRVKIESSENIIVYTGSTLVPENTPDTPGQIGSGVSFIIVKANQPTTIFSVSNAYVIAPIGNAEIRINGMRITLPKGSCKNISPGKITLTSNETVIVETISEVNYFSEASTLYQFAGLRGFATYLIPANRVELTYPPPKPSEAKGEGGLNYTLIGGVAAVIVIAAAVLVILRKRS